MVDGERGVSAVLRILSDELDLAMALLKGSAARGAMCQLEQEVVYYRSHE